MKKFIIEVFTDAAGRPEMKMILGIPTFIAAIVYGIWTREWKGFLVIMGTALSLMGLTTLGDAAIDKGA